MTISQGGGVCVGQLGAIVMVIRECLLARGGPLHTRAANEHSRSFTRPVPSSAFTIQNL